MHQRLFEPFEQKVARAATVYIAPDGILNLVPFARLKIADGRYWSEQQLVCLLQSGRDLLRADPIKSARGLLALGGIDFDATAIKTVDSYFLAGSDRSDAINYAAETFRGGFAALPATRDEAKDVAECYELLRKDEPVEVWSGVDATKARLMAIRSPPRVLHIASSGFYLPGESREPMLLSGIPLAGANRELAGTGADGILFALEAQGLNLDGTELVVLSGANTARVSLDYSPRFSNYRCLGGQLETPLRVLISRVPADGNTLRGLSIARL
jgi:CHAT domain-containing protein